MNKFYKTIRNALTGQTVVTSERAKSRGKEQKIATGQSFLSFHRPLDNASNFACYLKIASGIVLLTGLTSLAHAGETITFPGSSLGSDPIYVGGKALFSSSSLSDNSVTVNGGIIGGHVYGGVTAGNADVFNNVVTISGGTVTGNVNGGYSRSGNVMNNSVIITGGSLKNIYGGDSPQANVKQNSVFVSGGSVNNVFGGFSFHGIGDITGNTVTLSNNALVNGSVIGGQGAGSVVGNTVIISDNVSVKYNVYGGYVEGGSGNTTGNSVIMTGGQVDGNIYGGFSSSHSATQNIVTISGNPQLDSTNTSLYGGRVVMGWGDSFTGNTLNFSAHPVSVNEVTNFQYYNFTLDPVYANDLSTALINARQITLGDGKGTASSIKVVGIHSGNILNVGDQFILMQAVDMSGDGIGLTTTGIAQQGISLLYDVRTDVDINGNVVSATILDRTSNNDSGNGDNNNGRNGHNGNAGNGNRNNPNGGKPAARVNPQLQALPNGYLAGAQLVTRGADMIVDDVFGAIKMQEQEQGLHLFAVAFGGHSRYNSGSHIKSNDFLFTGGANYQYNNLTVGAFLEGGLGDYDTYNSFYNAANVHGDGNSRYYGLGLLGRYDFDNGFYTDASLRFGRNSNKFHTTDIQNLATGQFASYDLKSSYISAHIGTGYIMQLNDNNQLDLSAKYLYTTLGGKDANIAGDNIHFDRIDSHRARLNATINHQYSEAVTFNAGLGYEHEFDGKATATTYGIYNIDAPSVRGGTGIVSIGANITPTANQRLTLDIKANGYGGKREGVGASFRINYAF